MPTEELEHELRRAFAWAADGYQHSEQARQRLLQCKYRPRSSHRRLIAGITAVASAGSVALGLGFSGVLGAASARSTGAIRTAVPARVPATIRTAAFTLTSNANGTDTLTLTMSLMQDPAVLQQALAQDSIRALVKTGTYCRSSPAAPNPLSIGVLSVRLPIKPLKPTARAVMVINPAAMPSGTELFFGYSSQLVPSATQVGHSLHVLFTDLIYTSSYTCSSGGLPPATP